ncbi:AAA family ATPase [Treponema denticola]|uniref:ATP-dependent nuclease n=1 Tax=Treponema denticola TaxID=158 RepID=UPI0021F83F9C|nr:AAA family ATPase [Treponema denticola]UYT09016.1 AAA family ATPase [Treponema denticola]
MYLSEIKLWNFRKYGRNDFDINVPHLVVPFHQGMNVLVGENDSGKTAIIDAVKLVLKTQSYEWLRVTDDDFYNESDRLRIELLFEDLTDDEAKNFIEWLCYKKQGNQPAVIYLRVVFEARRNPKTKKITTTDIRAGEGSALYLLTSEAREYLKVTYLKPLRDAENELMPGKYSRLSNILLAHEVFTKEETHENFINHLQEFNLFVDNFFSGNDEMQISDTEGAAIKEQLDEYLQSFCFNDEKARFSMSETTLKSILGKLQLSLEKTQNPGLGTLNRLYMAAELLNLQRKNWDGVKLGLIEELEAHLHPQAQLKVIEKLQRLKDVQLILTTHSPNLASKINLKNIILCANNTCYPMGHEFTKLSDDNYCFLQTFLDVTKANLFFAKGLIFVEGWSEQVFLPSFAKLLKKLGMIKKDITQAGVSIINIQSIGFFNYTHIFQRKNNNESIPIPIAVITDSDVKYYEKDKDTAEIRIKTDIEIEQALSEKMTKLTKKYDTNNNIRLFVTKEWTFEYALYKSTVFGNLFEETVKKVHPRITSDSSSFEEALAQKPLSDSLNKRKIAYLLASGLDNVFCSENELKSDAAIQNFIEAVQFVCK